MLIYQQLPDGNNELTTTRREGGGGVGGGSLRYKDLCAIVFYHSTVDFNSVLVKFSPGLPNHLLLLKNINYFFVLIGCAIFYIL